MIGNWTDIALQDIISYAIGGDWGYNPEESIDDSTLAYCIRGSEIKEWNKNRGKTAVIRRIKNSSLENRKLEIGDILLEISGGGPEQPVGRVLYIDEETIKTQDNHPIVCTNFFRRLHLNDTVCSRYVYYYLHFFYIIGNTISLQGGSNNLRNLKFKDYQLIRIPLPSLTEQKQIAEKLDKLFDQIETIKEASNKIPELLKNFRQQVLTYAVTGKLLESTPEPRMLGELIDELKYGTSKKADYDIEGFPVLRIPNINYGAIDSTDLKYVPLDDKEYNQLSLQEGDILVIRSNGSLSIVGQCAIVRKECENWVYAGYLIRIRCTHELLPEYLNYIFQSYQVRKQIVEKSHSMSGVNNFSADKIKQLEIARYPVEVQKQIVEKLNSIFGKLNEIEKQYNTLCEKLDKLPQTLLCKAFKGVLVYD